MHRPDCQFCGKESSNWKLNGYWCCAPCAVNLEIMKMDHILEHSKTPHHGGPKPSNRLAHLDLEDLEEPTD